jgi:hypothetical protein
MAKKLINKLLTYYYINNIDICLIQFTNLIELYFEFNNTITIL